MPTILVVDDEPRIRDVVEYALTREGYDVIAASNGEEALKKLDCALVDLIVLPFGTGLGVYALWALLTNEGRRLFEVHGSGGSEGSGGFGSQLS